MEEWKCPRCHNTTTDYPALSRRDNKTPICSSCGQKEAFLDMAIANKPKKEKLAFLARDGMWLPTAKYQEYLKKLDTIV